MSRKIKNSGKSQYIGINIISTAFFVIITAIFPLYITRTHYTAITGDKANFFLTMTAFTSGAIIVALFLTAHRFQAKDYFVKNEPTRRPSVAELAVIAFILFVFLSSVFSPFSEIVWRSDSRGRWEGFWVFLCYVLTFFIIGRFYKPRKIHFLIFAGSAILVSVYGILQFLDFDILVRTGFFTQVPPAAVPPGANPFEIQYITWAAPQFHPPLTRIFRTTLGNINIVAAYSSLVTVLFAGLFAGENEEKSKWSCLYLGASAMAFSLLLIGGNSGDAGRLGVLGAMVLAVPYWISDRRRFGRILIVLASWAAVFAAYNGYLSILKNRLTPEPFPFPFGGDWNFLNQFTPQSPFLFGGLAAVFLGAGLVLLLVIKKWPDNSRFIKILGVGILALMLIGGVIAVEFIGSRRADNPSDIVFQAREMMHGRIEDHFGSYRGWIWRRTPQLIRENPIFGTGPATFHWALGEEVHEISRSELNKTFDTPHNTYLQMAANLGIPALLAYLTFIGSLFIPALKRAFTRPVLLAFGAAAVAYMIQSFFQIDTPIDRPLLWVALGIVSGEVWRDKVGA